MMFLKMLIRALYLSVGLDAVVGSINHHWMINVTAGMWAATCFAEFNNGSGVVVQFVDVSAPCGKRLAL